MIAANPKRIPRARLCPARLNPGRKRASTDSADGEAQGAAPPCRPQENVGQRQGGADGPRKIAMRVQRKSPRVETKDLSR